MTWIRWYHFVGVIVVPFIALRWETVLEFLGRILWMEKEHKVDITALVSWGVKLKSVLPQAEKLIADIKVVVSDIEDIEQAVKGAQ